MTQYTDFGKSIKHRLIDLGQTNTWLCKKVSEKTGRYFDDAYLSKLCRGVMEKPEHITAICEILDIQK